MYYTFTVEIFIELSVDYYKYYVDLVEFYETRMNNGDISYYKVSSKYNVHYISYYRKKVVFSYRVKNKIKETLN